MASLTFYVYLKLNYDKFFYSVYIWNDVNTKTVKNTTRAAITVCMVRTVRTILNKYTIYFQKGYSD